MLYIFTNICVFILENSIILDIVFFTPEYTVIPLGTALEVCNMICRLLCSVFSNVSLWKAVGGLAAKLVIQIIARNEFSYTNTAQNVRSKQETSAERNVELGDRWWHSCWRHCATSRKVGGSIPDGVTGSFHRLNPLGLSALGATDPGTEMFTRDISWG